MEEEKPKVLVLSCGTGGGHNSAAKAIVEAFQKNNVEAEFKEYLEIINPKLKEYINRLYIRTTKGEGKVFKVTYRLGELYQKTKIKSPVYGLNSLNCRKLYQYLIENNYQYVVTTHIFAAQALTTIKKRHPEIHFIAVATDYVSIPFWEETNPDYFVIPNEDLKPSFLEKGISEEKLIPFGIPVSLKVLEKRNREKQVQELGLNPKKRYILVTTGSMGFGKNEELVAKLLEEKQKEDVILFSCGNNEEMKKELEEKIGKREDFLFLSYTNNLISYMQISDIVLTKPGGLTTTEVTAIRKPMIHTMPIPGCETYNAEYFAKRNMSLKSESVEEICQNIKRLKNDENLKKQMIENQRKYINPQASEKIVEFVMEKIKEIQKEK